MNTNYFNKLFEASKTNYINIENNFDFSQFESINIHLILKALSEDANFWLNVNKRDVDNLYRPVIFALLANFFKTNYANSAMLPPRAGEKYHESLISDEEIRNTFEDKEDYVILEKRLQHNIKTKKSTLVGQYSSDKVKLLTKEELKKILVEEKLLPIK